MNPDNPERVGGPMRPLLVGILAMFAVGCAGGYEPAPANLVEAELWEYESIEIPLTFVPSYVSSIYVEVTACVVDGSGPGYLFVSTDLAELELSPRYCSNGNDVHTLWMDLSPRSSAWMDVEPVYTRDTTEIIASFRVLGW